jgi:MoaA/NifB/PqqE/SkfB family radical SAM enzyme
MADVQNHGDMDVGYFEEVCKKLPEKVTFRFLGKEPTMHPRLFDMLKIAAKHNHLSSLVTNGKKLADYNYAKELKGLGVPVLIGMSMNGGSSRDDWYECIDGEKCSEWKMRALENIASLNFRRSGLTAIIVRGLNEPVIADLYKLAREYSRTVIYIHYRTMAPLGNFLDSEPYSVAELREKVGEYLGRDRVMNPHRMAIGGFMREGCRDCCYQFWYDKKLQIGLIGFATEDSAKCWFRGRLMNDYSIEPFFGTLREGRNEG